MDSNWRHTKSITYKRSHVEFTCTDDQKERLESELKATGLVVEVKITDPKSDDHAIPIEQNPLNASDAPSPQHESLPLKGIVLTYYRLLNYHVSVVIVYMQRYQRFKLKSYPNDC